MWVGNNHLCVWGRWLRDQAPFTASLTNPNRLTHAGDSSTPKTPSMDSTGMLAWFAHSVRVQQVQLAGYTEACSDQRDLSREQACYQ
jgi:hypothetical protein